MRHQLKVLYVDSSSGFYRIQRFAVGDFFGPIDLGLHLSQRHDCLCFGSGLLAGSILPGSNRLFFTGLSPCWHGFYVSSMGGAALVFNNLGIDMVCVVGRAPQTSVLYLNRVHGEEIEVELHPIDVDRVWREPPHGVYAIMEHVLARFSDRYSSDPRVLAVGPAARATDFGAIASAPVHKGRLTAADTWAGRGGLGSRLLQSHNLGAVVFGGTFVDDDFRDRRVADEWFEQRYRKKLIAKDLEATVKYRFDPRFETGGTFGMNFKNVGGRVLAFNYQSIHWPEEERVDLHQRLIVDHYLRQFNEEIIEPKSMKHCGEPCVAVCKKIYKGFKKDFEPYQTMGPLCGIFDQRAAERLNHHADQLGFDAIAAGGILSWLMECLGRGILDQQDLGVTGEPVFAADGFAVETDSHNNAELGIALLDAIVERRGRLDFSHGPRRWARQLARERGRAVIDTFLYNAFARGGWMVPNQYWTPGVVAPMPMMGKYYMHYGPEFFPPRELGRRCAQRMIGELELDNLGICRFHRSWAEEMAPAIMGSLYSLEKEYVARAELTAIRINCRNAALPWESARCGELVHSFLRRQHEVEANRDPHLLKWLDLFDNDPQETAHAYWFEILRGIHETLRE